MSTVVMPLTFPRRIVRSPKIWDYMTAEMRADALGPSVMDHTAAIASALKADIKSLEFPGSARFNIDRMHFPDGRLKTIDFGDSRFLLRSDYAAGFGHFVRFFQSGPGYGGYDGITINGGTFDQNGRFMSGHLFCGQHFTNSTISGLTVVHRDAADVPVALNPDTDTFTSEGHGFTSGTALGLKSGSPGGYPSGPAAESLRWYVVNTTPDTFQLSATVGGTAFNFLTSGSALFVFLMPSWGFAVGGEDNLFDRCEARNGRVVFADGFHLTQGSRNIIANCRMESGDDAFALGSEIGDVTVDGDLSENTFIDCHGVSNAASLVKVYVNNPARKVTDTTFIRPTGSSGATRNGGIAIEDLAGDASGGKAARIDGVSIVGAAFTVGSPGRTQAVNANLVEVRGAKNVSIEAAIERDTFAFKDYLIDKSDAVTLTLTTSGTGPSSAGSATNSTNVTVA